MYRVIGTDTYLAEIAKWTKADQEAAEKIPSKLASILILAIPVVIVSSGNVGFARSVSTILCMMIYGSYF